MLHLGVTQVNNRIKTYCLTYLWLRSEHEVFFKLTTTHTCPYIQKYDHKTKYNRVENTSPRYDPHVKSVYVPNSVDSGKEQADMYFLSSHGTAAGTASHKFA